MKTSVLLVAVTALAGCGGSGTSVNQACTDIATARCNKLASCTNVGNSTGAGIVVQYGDLATCISRETMGCVNNLGAPHQGNNPDLSEMCKATVMTASCADFLSGNLSGPCQPMGSIAAGASCALPGQCATGYCNGAKHAACGTCGSGVAVGGDCSTSACTKGLDCVSLTSTTSPPPMMCVQDGASGAMCNHDNPCANGLTCVGVTKAMPMGTCMAAAETVGATCSTTTGPGCDKAQGLWCNNTTKACTAVIYANDGDNCGEGTDGNLTECKGGDCFGATLGANPTPGQCKARVLEGSGCDTVNGPFCTSPAKCVTTNGTAGMCALVDATKC
jgi:hypothetical protein